VDDYTKGVIDILTNAADYCHSRAAMAWTDAEREKWRKKAADNEARITELGGTYAYGGELPGKGD